MGGIDDETRLVSGEDREERPGVRFADLDLIGIGHRLVVSPRTLAKDEVEYRQRRSGETRNLPLAELFDSNGPVAQMLAELRQAELQTGSSGLEARPASPAAS